MNGRLKACILALLATLWVAPASAQMSGGAMFPGPGVKAYSAAGYTGPGDVVSGATHWYGLRAYNAAYATGSNPAVDLVDQAGANQITINILSNGTLDLASIATWVTANSVTTIKVKKISAASEVKLRKRVPATGFLGHDC